MSPVGELLDKRYRVGAILNTSEFLVTYAAKDTKLDRDIVIKVLSPRWSDNNAVRDALIRNSESAARMSSDLTIRTYGSGFGKFTSATGDTYETPYLVMERVTGIPMQQAINSSTLSLADAKRITKQILDAIEYAHRMGLRHGNINTHTVSLCPDKNVKLDDFGLALALHDCGLEQSQLGDILGDQSAISPEYLSNPLSDNRSDLYSIGAVYYAMLTGNPPFTGTGAEVVAQQLTAVPSRPTGINPFVSDASSDVVLKALSASLDAGYQSAPQFQAALDLKPQVRQHATAAEVLSPLRGVAEDNSSTTSLADIQHATEQFQDLQTTEIPLVDSTTTQESNAWKRLAKIGVGVVILAGLIWLILALTSGKSVDTGTVAVADVSGQQQASALAQLKQQGLKPTVVSVQSDTVPVGNVVDTDPTQGIVVEHGTAISVKVSAGKEPVKIPDLGGLNEADAKAKIESAGLKIGQVTEVESSSVQAGFVVSSYPLVGSEVAPGATVDVSISNGKVMVPKVVGKKYETAVQTLQGDLGLIVNPVPDYRCKGKRGIVTKQSIKPGQTNQGVSITIEYSVRGASCP